MNEIIIEIKSISCSICLDDVSEDDTYETECNHIFCKDCLDKWFSRGNKECPLCRQIIDKYRDNEIHYKLVIYEKQIVNNINSDQLSLPLRQELIKLRIYMWFSLCIFGIYLYQYYTLVNYDSSIIQDYQVCLDDNNKLLNDNTKILNDMISYKSIEGTYINIVSDSGIERCFYRDRYFGGCSE